ncbi:MAG: hypothetical protein QX189_20025 [Methylococcales bacterium]
MTNTSSTHTLKMQTEGLDKATKQSLQLKKNLEGAAAAARTPYATQAAQAGVAKKSTAQPGTASDTNLSRGIGGQTGASGRDFAAQAQGLGGLVHVYATFAANLFAVSAAFSALSTAMDTSNLVKGLDQIGASSGRNLGSLAKQMVSVADGAISLRDAMTSTAMASSGGMTNSAILRMTEVAKKASLALGRDLPDSMERLTKGIVKTQPELLDELGIMTRMIPAQREYARELGKSMSSLTEFEKRQAFANAVLDEGEKKFGSINLSANSYSKILSSMKNLAQSGLELVNTALSPILSILSSSPIALTVAMGAFASMLLKQAIPAMGMFRENANRMAEESHAHVKKVALDSARRIQEEDLAITNAGEHAFKTAKSTQQRITDMKVDYGNNLSKAWAAKANANPLEMTDRQIVNLEKQYKKLNESTEAGAVATAETLRQQINSAKTLRLEMAHAGENDQRKYEEATSAKLDHARQSEIILAKINKDAVARRILASVADEAAVMGPVRAWKLLNSEIAKSKSGGQILDGEALGKTSALANGLTRIKGALSIATSAIGTAISAFGVWGQAIGIVIAAIGALDVWLSNNAKHREDFNTELTNLGNNVKFLSTVTDTLWAQDSSKWLSAESMQARANAITSISDNLVAANKKVKDVKLDASWYDNVIDSIASTFGGGADKNLAKAVNKGIINSVNAINSKDVKDKYVDMFKKIYGIVGKELSLENIQGISLSTDKVSELINANKLLARELGSTAASASAAKDTFVELDKAYGDLVVSMSSNDPTVKLGIKFLDLGKSFDEVFRNATTGFQELVRLANNPANLALLGSAGESLAKQRDALNDVNNAYNANAKALKVLNDEQARGQDTSTRMADLTGQWNSSSLGKAALANQKKLRPEIRTPIVDERIALLEKEQKALDAAKTKLVNDNSKLNLSAYEKGISLISRSFNLTVSAAAIKFESSMAALLTGTAGIAAREDASIKEISLRQESNSILINLIRSQEELRIALMLSTLEARKLDSNASPKDKQVINEEIRALTQEQKVIKSSNPLGEMGKGLKSDDAATRAGSNSARNVAMQLMKPLSENAALEYDKQVVKVNAEVSTILEKYTEINRVNQIGIDLQKISLNTLNSLSQITEGTSAQLLSNQTQEIIGAGELSKLANDREAIEEKFQLLYDNALTKKQEERVIDSWLLELDKQKNKEEVQQAANVKSNLDGRIALLQRIADIRETAIQKDKLKLEQDISLTNSTKESELSNLQILKDIGAVEESSYLRDKNKLDILNLSIAKRNELALLESSRDSARNKAFSNFDTANAKTWEDPNLSTADKLTLAAEAGNLLDSELKKANSTMSTGVQLSEDKYNRDLKVLEVAGAYNVLLAKQTEEMNKMVSITSSLSTVFGDLGTAIGKTGESILKMNQDDTKYAAKKQALLDKANGPNSDVIDRKNLSKDLAKLDEQHATDQLDNISSLAGENKKMFGEKTAAFKIMATVEKTTAAMSMALKLQQMAVDLTTLGPKIAGGVASLFSQGGWAGFAGAAAFLAMMASLGFSGGTSVPTPGFSAEDQQKVQGTGQSYVNGKLVDNGGGALGDSKAKSDSIVKGIETLGATNFEMLEFQKSKTYEALVAIRDNTLQFVKAVGTTTGITGGLSPFGTTEGSSSGALGFGSNSTAILNTGVQIIGSLKDLVAGGGTKRQFENVHNEWSSWWGISSGSNDTINYTALKSNVDSYIQGIFQGFQDTLVSAADILGTTEERIKANLDEFVVSINTSGKGLTGSEFAAALMADIGIELDRAANIGLTALAGLANEFQNFGESSSDFLIRLVSTSSNVVLAMTSINKAFATLNKTRAQASMLLADASGGLDIFLANTQKFSDGFLSEAERNVPIQAAINKEFTDLGVALPTTRDGFKELIMGFKFTDDASYTTYSRLIALSDAMNQVLPAMAAVLTAEELRKAQLDQEIRIYQLLGEESKALTLSRTEELKLLDERLRPAQLYIYALEDEATLKDKLKTAYDKVSGAIKTTITGLQTSIKTLKDYKSALAQGNNSILTPYQKYLQAKQTAYDTSVTASSTGTSTQEVAARNEAISKLPTVAGTFLDASRTLFASGAQYTADYSMVSEYISELGASLDSQLTDAQKQLDALDSSVSFLTSIDTTLADVYSLLEQYTQATANTAGARGAAGAAGSAASGGVITGKGGWTGTLAEINTLIRGNIVANPQNVYDVAIQRGFSAALISQATGTPSANILAWAANYGGKIPAFANGGLANGLAMVGEQGPELVNFRNPGRVYSNRASNDMLNNSELVQEVRNLREELKQLRQDQREQTGHLINANYDANNRAAVKVVDATDNISTNAAWAERNKVKVA